MSISYNPSNDFQIGSNQGTPWLFGYSVKGGADYALIAFDKVSDNRSAATPDIGWSKTGYNTLGTPAAWRNLGTSPRYGVAPGQLSLHPGPRPNGDYAIMRFKAPRAAAYRISGQFYAGDSGNSSGRILLDQDFNAPLKVFATTDDNSRFDLGMLALAEGQTVDFVVGNNGDFSACNTPIALTITDAESVIHDATTDFQAGSNPSGVWRYGYSERGGADYALIPFDNKPAVNAGLAWTKTGYTTAGTPTAWLNLDTRRQYGVDPRQLSLHPGPRPDGDYAILRFTAPATATYELRGQFFAGDVGNMNGRILKDGDFSRPLQQFSSTTDQSIFNVGPLPLQAGQTLDFVVGNNGSFGSGNTPIAVTLRALSPGGPAPGNPADEIRAYVDALPRLALVSPRPGTTGPIPNLPAGLSGTQTSGASFVNQRSELAILKAAPEITWPGALVQGASINDNNFAGINLPRAPGRIRISTQFQNQNQVNQYADLPVLGAGEVDTARNRIVRALAADSVGTLTYETVFASNVREAMVKLGVAYKGGAVSGSVNASLNTSYDEKTYIALFTQEFYTAVFDPDPAARSPFFGEGTTLADVQRFCTSSNPPLYVSNVKYGRQLMISFTSSLSKTVMTAAIDAAAQRITVNASASLSEALSQMRINVLSIGTTGEVSMAPVLASTAEQVVEALKTYVRAGIRFDPVNNPGSPIAFTMNYVGSLAGSGANALAIAQMTTDSAPEVVSLESREVHLGSFQVWDGTGGGWKQTGIDIKPGDQVRFFATGTNTSGVFGDWSGYGPEGWSGWDRPSGSGFPINNRSPFALIGRFGGRNDQGADTTRPGDESKTPRSSSFFIGTSQTVVAGSPTVPGYGPLFLGTNDNDPTNGNAALKFTVDVWITHAKF